MASGAGISAKRTLKKLVERYDGVPVLSMTPVDAVIDNGTPAMPTILVPAIVVQQRVCRLVGQCYVAELETPGGQV